MRGNAFEFAILALAVWRMTHMLTVDAGPFHIFARLRHWCGADEATYELSVGFLGDLLACHWCTSVWVAAPAALLWQGVTLWAAGAWLAFAGASALLEHLACCGEGD